MLALVPITITTNTDLHGKSIAIQSEFKDFIKQIMTKANNPGAYN